MFEDSGMIDDMRIINKRVIVLVSLLGVLTGLVVMMVTMDRLYITGSKQHKDVFKLVSGDSMRELNSLENELHLAQVKQNESEDDE